MADQLEHVSVNVEAAIAKRLHMEAQHISERADLLDQQYRDLLAEAGRAADLNEKARLKLLADRAEAERERFRTHAVETQTVARNAVYRAKSLPNDTNLDRLEPVTRIPFTKAEVKRHQEEATTIAWERLRAERDDLLVASDWRVLPDSPAKPKEREAWAAYRAQLRDLPSKTTDPAKARWPKPPGGGD